MSLAHSGVPVVLNDRSTDHDSQTSQQKPKDDGQGSERRHGKPTRLWQNGWLRNPRGKLIVQVDAERPQRRAVILPIAVVGQHDAFGRPRAVGEGTRDGGRPVFTGGENTVGAVRFPHRRPGWSLRRELEAIQLIKSTGNQTSNAIRGGRRVAVAGDGSASLGAKPRAESNAQSMTMRRKDLLRRGVSAGTSRTISGDVGDVLGTDGGSRRGVGDKHLRIHNRRLLGFRGEKSRVWLKRVAVGWAGGKCRCDQEWEQQDPKDQSVADTTDQGVTSYIMCG